MILSSCDERSSHKYYVICNDVVRAHYCKPMGTWGKEMGLDCLDINYVEGKMVWFDMNECKILPRQDI